MDPDIRLRGPVPEFYGIYHVAIDVIQVFRTVRMAMSRFLVRSGTIHQVCIYEESEFGFLDRPIPLTPGGGDVDEIEIFVPNNVFLLSKQGGFRCVIVASDPLLKWPRIVHENIQARIRSCADIEEMKVTGLIVVIIVYVRVAG